MMRHSASHGGIAVALAGLALGAGTARADRLHVAPHGDDAGPGTSERPFRTLERAQRAVRERAPGMREDLVVELAAGTYRLRAPLRLGYGDSGRNGHRVIYQAAGYGTHVTLSGGRPLTRWRRAGSGLWRAPLGGLRTRQLYVAGRHAPRAALGGPLPGRVRKTRTGYLTTSRAPLAWRRPRDVELVYTRAFPYSEARCGVARIARAGSRTRIVMDQPCFARARRLYREPGFQRGLPLPTDAEGSPSFLRRRGSWVLDRGALLYRGPRPPRDAIVPHLQRLVSGDGVRDLTLRGLTFAHTTWLGPDRRAGFPQIYGGEYYAGGPVGTGGEVAGATLLKAPAAVAFARSQRIAIEGNRFTALGSQALELATGGAQQRVLANRVDGVSGGGIEVGGSHDDRVEDNRVRRVGVDYRGSLGISVGDVKGSTVAHNLVQDTPYSGIVVLSPTERTRVLANRVRRTARVLYDGGGIYVNGPQGGAFANGLVVRGNHVSDTTSRFNRDNGIVPIALYTDDFSDWITIEGNVAHGNYRSFGGVEPRHVRFAGNFWDERRPGWYPRGSGRLPTFAGNALLPRRGFAAACRARPACAAVLATAGPRR